jgi:hypothetical protein
VLELEAETHLVADVELLDLAVQLDRQLEGLGVALEVGDHLIPGRVTVGITGKGKARQGAVAPGREERQRLPALVPGGADRIGALEDQETTSLADEEVPHGKAGLAGADDGDFHVVAGKRPCAGVASRAVHHPSASRPWTSQTPSPGQVAKARRIRPRARRGFASVVPTAV